MEDTTERGESEDRSRAGDRPISRSVDDRQALLGSYDEPLEGQTTIEDAFASQALDDLFGKSGQFTDAVRAAVAAAIAPAARHLIEAKLEEETAAVELGAIAGIWTGEAVTEARRRYAALAPSMTLAGAMRSVVRDLKSGDWQP